MTPIPEHFDLPEDRPEHDDPEVEDALTVEPFDDELIKALMDIGGVYRKGFMRKVQAE